MGRKNLVLSLIFPIICVLPALFWFVANLFFDAGLVARVIALFSAAVSLFPLFSVIKLKNDIASCVKWQGLLTAAAAVSALLTVIIVNIIPTMHGYNFALPGMMLIPLGILAVGGITYGKLLKNENRRVLKWFTAFLSTPILYYLLFWLWLWAALNNAFSSGLNIH